MHTKTDIEILIRGASDLTDDRKKELLAALPDFYVAVADSLLLDDQWKSKLLFAFPYFTDEKRQECVEILSEGQEEMEEKLEQVMQQMGGHFEREFADLDLLLKKGKEALSRADDELNTIFMEEGFSQDDS